MIKCETSLNDIQSLNSSTSLNGAQYYRLIAKLMETVHTQIPENKSDGQKQNTLIDFREEFFNGQNRQRAVLYVLSNGCEWALKSGNGCTMCGHLAKQTRKDQPVSHEDYVREFKSAFATLDFKKYPLLNLYNNGSFFNDNEIPAEARRDILKTINENKDIQMLVLETRPEFVQTQKMAELKRLIPDKHVEIAIGLELEDDFMRYTCTNKGFSLKQFDQAAKIMAEMNLGLRTYVMLKPPFLTEKEGIEQAVRTVKHAFAVGSATVSLEACTVQPYTMVEHLYERALYKPPWVWSIIEVVNQTAHLGKLVVGLFQFYPSPNKVAYNCDACSGKVMDAIREYNRSLDPKVLRPLTCGCKEEWEKELQKGAAPLQERIVEALGNM